METMSGLDIFATSSQSLCLVRRSRLLELIQAGLATGQGRGYASVAKQSKNIQQNDDDNRYTKQP
jgi:hypothetical protein